VTNVIPFGKHTLEKLRARNIARLAPDPSTNGRPWPFNCFTHDGAIKPWPDPATLPPVAAHRFPGVRLQDDDKFQFGRLPAVPPDLRALESDLENVLLQYKFDHPGCLPLDLVPPFISIVRKLLRQAAGRTPPSAA
jgi:hypothetical protein